MNAEGWIFLIASLCFVCGLVAYCFYRVVTAPKPPAEEEEHRRSA